MSLNLVSEQLLTANNINQQDLFSLLGQLSERKLDYADLYFQSGYHESWVLEDRIIKDGSWNIDQGVGVRAISGEKTGFAYADQITLNALTQSATAARSIVREQGNGKSHTLGAVMNRPLYPTADPLQSLTREEKIALLHRVDAAARAADKRVQEVSASLSGVVTLPHQPMEMFAQLSGLRLFSWILSVLGALLFAVSAWRQGKLGLMVGSLLLVLAEVLFRFMFFCIN